MTKKDKWLVVTVILGDSKYKLAENRLRKQIAEFEPFFDLVVVNESNLVTFAPRTLEKYSKLLTKEVPGFGFWIWKAEVCFNMLKVCKSSSYQGCIYLDAGCELYSSFVSRIILKALLSIAKRRQALVFASGGTDLQYSKKYLINFFGSERKHLETRQIAATWFAVTPENSQRLIEDWMDICLYDVSLINFDYIEPTVNFNGFVAHRSDQSILSLICKQRGIRPVPRLDYSGRNMKLHSFRKHFHPIWTSRNLSDVKLESSHTNLKRRRNLDD